jgi:electron transfer flavoprotein beta subunit
MKIVVAVKRALDYTARVRVKPDGSGVELSGARMSMNPFCEIALEVRKGERRRRRSFDGHR